MMHPRIPSRRAALALLAGALVMAAAATRVHAGAGAVAVAGAAPRAVPAAEVAHPFLLWTKDDAATIRKRVETEPWAKESYRRLLKAKGGTPFVNLFKYQVLGDEKAGATERDYLVSFIGAPLDVKSSEGKGIGLHYDNYLHALRYDVLYDTLTPEQRKGVEDTFRKFVQYELEHPYVNDRLSLLPNMQLPRLMAAHMMAVSLRDEGLIRKIWAAPSGFKWFIDEYLSDGELGGFYNEEFTKMTSLAGELLLFCRGVDRLGLAELGYDFKGRSGASMRGYIESYVRLGYPRTDVPGGMPRYERVAMGDARSSLLGVFQHANVPGYLPTAPGAGAEMGKKGEAKQSGWDLWYSANMNGRDHRGGLTDKLQFPQWFEILHAKYPDGPFGYFLAQMRRPGDEKYIPTPFWGVTPIAPGDPGAKPPPAPSYVAPERGFAMLRANESPAYWESPSPAVAVQFASLYVHYTSDCFSLLGYHAFNRPIYLNRTISSGYNGGPWDFSVRGHCGVVVDAEQAQPIGTVPARHDFAPLVKFVSARGVLADPSKGYKGQGEVRSSDQPKEPFPDVYSNVDLSRSLFLTDQYLFDVYQLADKSGKPRHFHWLVHAPGVLASDQGWTPSHDLQDTLFNIEPIRNENQPRGRSLEPASDPAQSWVRISGEQKMDLRDRPADLSVVQSCILPDVSKSVLGAAWYDRKIGVRVRMLGEPGTTAFVFDTPVAYPPGTLRAPRDKTPQRPETGGVSVAVARTAPRTTFAALHEPFAGGASRIDTFTRIAQTEDAVAAAVTGQAAGVNDRVMVRTGDAWNQPITLDGGGERFTFVDHAFVRIGADVVEVVGGLHAMRVKVDGRPKLRVNGKDQSADIAGGFLTYAAR